MTVTHDTPFVEDIVPQPDDSVNRKNSLSEKHSDEAYLSAVDRCDMKTAQRMVDEPTDREILAMALEGAVQSEQELSDGATTKKPLASSGGWAPIAQRPDTSQWLFSWQSIRPKQYGDNASCVLTEHPTHTV